MHDHCCGGHRRARWDWDAFTGGFWGGGPRGRHFRGRMGRMFEQGDLKYVILQLIDEKPRHGYDIIKALEEKSQGAYSPSPGTVYPTLTMLEEMGYIRSTAEDGGKKVYEITPEGKQYLQENSSTVESIFERISDAVEPFFSSSMGEVRGAMRHLARSALGTAMKHADNKDVLARIAQVLERAATEIDGITP
ncbi:MAG: PadR family transcriptional regulator [Gemmatimonadota bacterium]|nr:PadR family transcriptional regulator [Gemmatimonadota bacterium]